MDGNGKRVVIVGGGLAGLAAATALAPRGFQIDLFESRPRLGGRASSFHDLASDGLVDTCQHVSMGCCTNLAHFCRTLGIDHFLEPQRSLYFLTPDGRVSTFQSDKIPAPFHLTRSFLSAHHLSLGDKLRIAWGLFALLRQNNDEDLPFTEWLQKHGQTQRTVDRFWGLVLVSALNESPERIGLRYARKVFLDGFLRHRRGFEVELPTVPLGRLYGEELAKWLERFEVNLHFQRGAKRLHVVEGRVHWLELRSEERIDADFYVSAMPFDRLLDTLSDATVEENDYFKRLKELETSPITSVHVWFDRPILELPHVVLVDCIGQWIFNRGETAPGQHYVQVVVSAARQFRGLGHEEVQHRVLQELRDLFANARVAQLLRARVVTEHAATFSVVPGVDRLRPNQKSPIENLFVAGDWTDTGWPATMEGAVRSGYLAAEALVRRTGTEVSFVQPDLR